MNTMRNPGGNECVPFRCSVIAVPKSNAMLRSPDYGIINDARRGRDEAVGNFAEGISLLGLRNFRWPPQKDAGKHLNDVLIGIN